MHLLLAFQVTVETPGHEQPLAVRLHMLQSLLVNCLDLCVCGDLSQNVEADLLPRTVVSARLGK